MKPQQQVQDKPKRRQNLPFKERFERKFKVTPGCWIWTCTKGVKGYGRITAVEQGKRVTLSAHRVSYSLYVGVIPDGMHVCHKCDNPSCVNPDHLWLGTNKDNVDDKMQKGRWQGSCRAGEKHHMVRLTEDIVLQIRADPRQRKVIAAEYGIAYGHVSMIKRRQIWAHLPARGDEVCSIDGRAVKSPILTEDDKSKIRSDKRKHAEIAEEYGIPASVVGKIKRGEGRYAKTSNSLKA